MKKTISVILSLVILTAMFPFASQPVASAAKVAGGEWRSYYADNLHWNEETGQEERETVTTGSGTWKLDDKGRLTVSGKGELKYYYDDHSPDGFGSFPWISSDYRGQIQSVVIEPGITVIDDGIFGARSVWSDEGYISFPGITGITIPDSVTSISAGAFDRAERDAIRIIYCKKDSYALAFAKEYKLPYILLDGTEAENTVSDYAGRLRWTLNKKSGVLTISGSGIMPPFKTSHPSWEPYYPYIKSVVIGEGITSVSANAFTQVFYGSDEEFPDEYYYRGGGNNSQIQSVHLPSTVTSIGRHAFYGVDTLREINVPNGVTTIGRLAFGYCSSLPAVTLPDSAAALDNGLFYTCGGLQSVVLPAGLTEIPNRMFYNCSSLTDIKLPSGVTRIQSSAFYGCGFTTIALPAALRTIDNDAFAFGKLTRLTIPDKVTGVGSEAFARCNALQSVVFKNKTLCSVGNSAFQYCEKLKDVTFSAAGCEIGGGAFQYCGNLEKVTFSAKGDSVIGNRAFQHCEKLKTVAFNLVSTIGTEAFAYCTSLKEAVLPGTMQSVGNRAFAFCDSLGKLEVRNPKMSLLYSTGYVEYEGQSIPDMITPVNTIIYGYKGSTAEAYTDPNTFNLMFVEIACADGHDHLFEPDKQRPACGESATVTYTCRYCGNSYQTTEYGRSAHSYVFFPDDPNAACNSTVAGRFVCTYCGNEYRGNGSLEHNYETTYPNGVTCESYCFKIITCTRCGETDYFNDFMYHDWKIEKKDVLDGTKGEIFVDAEYTCRRCGETHTYHYSKSHEENSSHNYTQTVEGNGCCEMPDIVTCTVCGEYGPNEAYSYPADLPPEIESWGYPPSIAVYKSTEPTCTSDGKTKYVACSDCGKVFIAPEVIPAKGHTEVTDEAVAPTCTTGGKTEGSHCSVCGKVLTEQKAIPATGHSFGPWAKLDDAQHQRVCANDNSHVEKEKHRWDAGKRTREASCLDGGEKLYTCIVCGATKTVTLSPATPTDSMEEHKFDNGTVTVEATCEQEGEMTYTCTVCGAKKTEVIPATGHSYGPWTKLDDLYHQCVCANDNSHVKTKFHSWDEGAVTAEATCTQKGELTYTCPVCGAKKTETIHAKGHSYGPWTELDDSQHQRVCANDASHVETGEHLWDEGIVQKEATPEEEGEKVFTCTVCGAVRTEPIEKLPPEEITDDSFDITVSFRPGAFGAGVTLKVQLITDPGPLLDEPYTSVTIYDISAFIGNANVQPNSSVTVRIPLPEGYNAEAVEVYHITDNGAKEKMEIRIENGYIVFTADSFSRYVVVDTSTKVFYIPGDVDGDGELTSGDARLALRASVQLEKYEPGSAQFLAADADGSGTIESGDARLILRASVKLEDPAEWGKRQPAEKPAK